ncbi:MAG: hypothetical protein UD963_09030 [Christensenellales bacterium]|nr:hypothetical protein [Christensenellales bacterium]
MDRNKRRVTYLTGANSTFGAYGMNDDKKKKNKKKSPFQKILRIVILAAALTAILVVAVMYALNGNTREGIGRIARIGATLSQNVSPFGDSVIFYDGTTLHCVAATGGNEWSYQIGTNADYDATEKRIVAWSGNDLYILNSRGRLIYNNKMSDAIQFASAGDEYVAVFVGDSDNGVVSVINSSGQIVDNIPVSNQTLLDIGFFMSTTTSSAQPTELMWMLGLNTTGTVISTELQTYQPGKLSTGKSSLGEHIAYSIYDENGNLNIVTTRQILHYSYRALEASSPTLIYGYTVEDVQQSGKTLYQLLVPAQEQSEGTSINNVRLMYGSVDRVLHLPGTCIAAKLGTKSVYGFSANAVYACRFGETTFRAYAMPINVTAVLGMMTDNRAVVASGSEIYVVELPT